MLYKPLSYPLCPSALQGRADGNTIPFKQMRKLRSREFYETFLGLYIYVAENCLNPAFLSTGPALFLMELSQC